MCVCAIFEKYWCSYRDTSWGKSHCKLLHFVYRGLVCEEAFSTSLLTVTFTGGGGRWGSCRNGGSSVFQERVLPLVPTWLVCEVWSLAADDRLTADRGLLLRSWTDNLSACWSSSSWSVWWKALPGRLLCRDASREWALRTTVSCSGTLNGSFELIWAAVTASTASSVSWGVGMLQLVVFCCSCILCSLVLGLVRVKLASISPVAAILSMFITIAFSVWNI